MGKSDEQRLTETGLPEEPKYWRYTTEGMDYAKPNSLQKWVTKQDYDALRAAYEAERRAGQELTDRVRELEDNFPFDCEKEVARWRLALDRSIERAESAENVLIQHYSDYHFTPTFEQAKQMLVQERNEKKAVEERERALQEQLAGLQEEVVDWLAREPHAALRVMRERAIAAESALAAALEREKAGRIYQAMVTYHLERIFASNSIAEHSHWLHRLREQHNAALGGKP